MLRSTVLLLLLSLCTNPAHAWGRLGHRLIGELTEQQLSPAARAQVRELMQDEPDPRLAAIATWADEVRDQVVTGWEWSRPLHYVHIRDAACRYDAARDCRDGACLVDAVQRYVRKLADTSLPRAERAEALKFLVHFVCDIHQPLHTGHRRDKGGNDFQISLRRPGLPPVATNLHSIWDYYLLANEDGPVSDAVFRAHVERLQAAPQPAAGTSSFRPEDAVRWAENSCALTNAPGFYPRRPGKLPTDYFERMRPLAEARLRLAAVRLALMIEGALRP